MTVSEEESAKMVAAYCADPEGYFKAHAVDGFLPPLAPAIMERLRRGFVDSMDEHDYYSRTQQFDADMTEHHETEMKNAAKKRPKVVHLDPKVRSLKKFGDADDDDLPF